MTRGTTPTITLTVTDVPLSGATIYLAFRQGRHLLIKSGSDLTVDTAEGTVAVTLTQAETLQFAPGTCEIQIRGIYATGVSFATEIITDQVYDVIQNGIIDTAE